MAQVNVTVRDYSSALSGYLDSAVADRMQAGAGQVRDLAKAEITAGRRVDTGRMRNALEAEVERSGNTLTARVVCRVDYALPQHEGTGVYGSGQPIVPRRARVLRFQPKGAQAFVFRPEVQGTEGLPFLTNALRRARPADFT